MAAHIGIEISTTAVRIAVVANESHPSLTSYASIELPEGAVRDGLIVDAVAVRSAVLECVAQLKLPRQSFARPTARVAVTGLRAIAREIEMPFVADNELDAAVQLQSLDVLPFPVSEALISARRLTNGRDEDGGRGPVLVVAAHRDLVQPFIEAIEQAGIVVVGVDLGASALIRTLYDPTEPGRGAEAIVSIGAHLTTVVVHDEGELVFLRTISGGGATVTGAISRALDVPFEDAERLKRELLSASLELDNARPELLAAWRDGATELLNEIRSSLDYYGTIREHSEISRVLMTGGGSLLPGLVDRFRLLMRVPVEVPNGLDRLVASAPSGHERSLVHSGAVAIGMALADSPGRKAIDLLPAEVRTARRVERATHGVFVGAAAVGLLMLCLGGLRFVQVHSAQRSDASLNASVATLQGTIPGFASTARAHAQVVRDEELAMPIVSQEVNWPAVFSALQADTPSSISTDGFSGTATASTGQATTTGAVTDPVTGKEPTQIGTINLGFSGTGYPSFRQWFNAMTSSKSFQIVEYSGVSSATSTVQFTAELGITSAIHTSRLAAFQEATS